MSDVFHVVTTKNPCFDIQNICKISTFRRTSRKNLICFCFHLPGITFVINRSGAEISFVNFFPLIPRHLLLQRLLSMHAYPLHHRLS